MLRGLSCLRDSGWRVGIVSNGTADTQLRKIERSGLGDRVDAWCVSGEAGVRKPDVRIFRLAAERCGAAPEAEGWMAGDTPEHDIAAGRGAGLRTIWIGRQDDWPAACPQADRTVAAAIGLLLERM